MPGSVAVGLIAATVLLGTPFAGAAEPGERSVVGADGGAEPSDGRHAHQACLAALKRLGTHRQPVQQAIARSDVAEFRKLQEAIGDDLRMARKEMESAVIVGAWKDRPYKDEGVDLTWRVDALEILNFIALAFTSEIYKNPTGKVPANVQDATARLFSQLDPLIERVDRLNQKSGEGGAVRRKAPPTKNGARS